MFCIEITAYIPLDGDTVRVWTCPLCSMTQEKGNHEATFICYCRSCGVRFDDPSEQLSYTGEGTFTKDESGWRSAMVWQGNFKVDRIPRLALLRLEE